MNRKVRYNPAKESIKCYYMSQESKGVIMQPKI